MRVVAGSGVERDLRQVEINRHIDMISRFIERSIQQASTPSAVTLILRSASSGPAKALVAMKDDLIGARVRAKAILAKLEPIDELPFVDWVFRLEPFQLRDDLLGAILVTR